MATITATATPVIKYSDTTDITLLLPADIAKFTEKDFALFTTQQQIDLSVTQVMSLTAKQVSTLPLKLVEPDTIAAITTAAVSSFDLKTFTTDQFAALTSLQFKALTTTQISSLTALQVDALTSDQASVFTSSQIAALAPKLVSVLNGSIIERLPAAAIAGFNAKNIIGLTTDSIAAITTDQAAVLTSQQIAALPSKIIAELPVDDIAVLTPAAIKGFTKANIGALDLTTLSSEQFSALTPTQTGLLSSAQLAALTVDFAPFLTSKAISLLTPVQLGSLATDVIAALDSVTVKGLTVKNIAGLTADQINALTSDQTGNLSKVQLSTFTTGQISNLSPESVLAIKPAIFKALNSDLLSHLDPTAFSSLTDVQLGSLTAGQVAGLSVDQINKFSGSQIALIKPAALANLTTSTISSLSDDAVASLTDKQLARFTTAADGQLAHFTPAQMTKFSTDAKTWLTTSKGFATIESTAKTGSGVNTTGTIVGAAAAETITSGGGNDIITTVGGLADKIISGAGSDTISITGDIHSVDAGDGVDTLNITSFSGNFSKISGVEVVKLAVASAGQTLALSGTANDFATVNADILADGQSLGLTGSYNVNKVAVSLIAGDVDANSSSTSFNVTATTGSNIIKTGSGADSIIANGGSDSIEAGSGNDTIDGGADNDTIDGGANVDSMTGGIGNDTFVFTTTSNGAGSAAAISTNFDTISDYTTGLDVIDFVNPLSIHATTAAPTNDALAKISATGLATFTPATTTMAGRITAVEAATNHVANSSAIFTDVTGTDAYVFISDANAGVSTGDVLIKLAGVGSVAKSLSISSTGDVTSIGAYAATTDFSVLSPSAAVYVVDGGAAISSNMTAINTSNANIDVIDANDTVAIVMTAAQEQGITAAKLASDDTIHIVDNEAGIEAAIGALTLDGAVIDLIDVEQVSGTGTADAVSLTYTQANALISASIKFAADDVITITDITDVQADAATALSIANLGGASIVLTGDGTVPLLQATATTQAATDHSTKWAGTQALTVTAVDVNGEHTISALDKLVLGGSGITLKGADAATSITYAEAHALPVGTKWSTSDAVTVTVNASNSTEVASAAILAVATVGGSSITLDTNNIDISLPKSVIATQLTNGADWGGNVGVTITTIGDAAAAAAAQIAYNTATIGGQTITLDTGLSISATDLTTALAAGQKFTGTLTVNTITDEATALTAFTSALTGASLINLTANDSNWSLSTTELTAALSAKQHFVGALTVAGIGSGSTNTAANSKAVIDASTTALTGATTVVLDSVSGTNAWAVNYADVAALSGVTFAADDVVTVTVPNTNEVAASVLSTNTTGGLRIVLDGDNAVSLTKDQAVTQIGTTNTKWHTDDVITVTGIDATDTHQADALQNYRKSALGGTSLVLETTETTGWTVTEDNLQSALAAAGNTAISAGGNTEGKLHLTTVGSVTDAVTITGIIVANETNALTVYTGAKLGAESVVLDAADNSWSVAGATLPTPLAAGIKFATGDTLTVTAIADGSRATALTAFTSAKTGAGHVVLDSGTDIWSIAGSDLTTALAANIKVDTTDALTVTGITTESTAPLAFTKALTGASSVVLGAADGNWSLAYGDMDTVLSTTTPTGIMFASTDRVTVTGLTTTNAVTQATALAAYTPTKVGATNIVLDSTGGAWSMTESALAQKASGVTFSNSDTLTIVNVSQTQELVVAPNAAALKYTATNTGASSVTLDAADNTWSITPAAATLAITNHVAFSTGDALTITGSGTDLATLVGSSYSTLSTLGGSSIMLADSAAPISIPMTVAVANDAIGANILFSAGSTVEITMSQANDTLDVTTSSPFVATTSKLGAADVSFKFGGTTSAYSSTAGGVTFTDVADPTALANTDTFHTATMDVITGFNTSTSALLGGNDHLDLSAFTVTDATATATDLTTTGDLIADGKYHIVLGTYVTSTGVFTANSAATSGTANVATLVVWDGDTTGGVDMVGVVLVGVTDFASADVL